MNHSVGFIGLGKMGKNMVLHLLEQGVDVVAFNRTKEKTDELKKENPKVQTAYTIEEFMTQLPSPRVIWLMVPASAKATADRPNISPIDEVLQQLISFGIQKGDIVIDGGNTYYKDTVRRCKELADKGVTYLDCGTSGGLTGARNGACLMVGGAESEVRKLTWLWSILASKGEALKGSPEEGSWEYFGPSGAGHFVKMVHNGVEYGMNQAIGEGFEILAKGPYALDFAKVAHNWNHGSVVRSWLVELLSQALDKDPKLDNFTGKVGGGETGKWTLEAASEFDVDAPVMKDAAEAREKSITKPTFAGKVVSALRAGYGGHKEPK